MDTITLLRIGRVIKKLMVGEDSEVMGIEANVRGDDERARVFFETLEEKGIFLIQKDNRE